MAMVPYVRCTMGARARMKAQSHVHGLMYHVRTLLCVAFGFSRHVSSCCLVPCGLQTMPEGFEVAVRAMSDAPEVTCGILNDVFDIHPDAALVRAILGTSAKHSKFPAIHATQVACALGAQASLQAVVHRIPSTPCAPMPVVRMAHQKPRRKALCLYAGQIHEVVMPGRCVHGLCATCPHFHVEHPRSVCQRHPWTMCASVLMGIPISSGVAYDVSLDLHSAVLPVANLALWRVWLRPLPQGEPFYMAYRVRLPSSSLSAARVFHPKT